EWNFMSMKERVEIRVKRPMKQGIARVMEEALAKISTVDRGRIFRFPIYATCGRGTPTCRYDSKNQKY
ncbi:hypothetical protein KEJ25_00550, partial [Candidatus Bathyarchaeota archaeon]|nr:hypothetical protein [Candidatus Bathyarchaeota archaeon]